MNKWPVQDAKSRFSEFLDTCVKSGPQLVTKRGEDTAVLVPVGQWRALTMAARPTLKQLLLEVGPKDICIPARGKVSRRTAPIFK